MEDSLTAKAVVAITPVEHGTDQPRIIRAHPEDGPWLVGVLVHTGKIRDGAGGAGAYGLGFGDDFSS